MIETLTTTHIEDAIAHTSDFLHTARGSNIDGSFAAGQLAERVESVAGAAEDLLTSIPHPKYDGLYVPLSRVNYSKFREVAVALTGHTILVPSVLVEKGTSVFYPAVVSDGNTQADEIRLHVLRQPYHRQLLSSASLILSAAGQSETEGIGDHNRRSSDGVEAEHFATLLAAGSDPQVQQTWTTGKHINHIWRHQPSDSVTAQVSNRLFGQEIPQSTVTITEQQVREGRAMLLWHEGLRNNETGRPETATRTDALVVYQSLGYEALATQNPAGLDAVKRLLA